MGDILTLSGGTGVGKTSLARALLKTLPTEFFMVRSVTSREPRHTDLAGEYAYVNELHIAQMHREDKLLWWKKYGSTFYATTKNSVRDALWRNGISVMILTPDCVEILHRVLENALGHDEACHSFYIESPSEAEIMRRLNHDGTRGDIAERMKEERGWYETAMASGKFTFIKNEQNMFEETLRSILRSLDLRKA